MPHSPGRGLLYTAPPTPESNRNEGTAPAESSDEEPDAQSAPAAADD